MHVQPLIYEFEIIKCCSTTKQKSEGVIKKYKQNYIFYSFIPPPPFRVLVLGQRLLLLDANADTNAICVVTSKARVELKGRFRFKLYKSRCCCTCPCPAGCFKWPQGKQRGISIPMHCCTCSAAKIISYFTTFQPL